MGSTLPTFKREPSYSRQRTADQLPPDVPARWSLKMSLSQVIVMWSVTAGTVIMAFLFGMYAGREQGLNSALEEYRGQAVRIRVPEPLAAEQDSGEALAALEAIGGESGTGPDAEGASTEGQEAAFDFSPEGKLSLAPGSAKTEGPESTDMAAAVKGEKSAPAAQVPKVAAKPETDKPEPAKSSPAKTADEKAAAAQTPAGRKTAAAGSGELAPLSKPAAGWYVQVAATRSHSEASGVYFRFKERNFFGVLEQANVRGQNYYRVILGPYSERDQALLAKTKIKNVGISRAEPFLKRVR